jgi:hypothetical protein
MKPTRRFQVLDALILIAFTVVGVAWCIAWTGWDLTQSSLIDAQSPLRSKSSPTELTWLDMLFGPYPTLVVRCSYCLRFLLMVWTLAFLILRLRQPRPPLGRVAFHWGCSGCVTALAFVLVTELRTIAGFAYDQAFGPIPLVPDADGIAEMLCRTLRLAQVDGAIVTTWCVLKVCRRLRCERTWAECFGIGLSAGWISIVLEGFVMHLAAMLSHVP